MTATQPKHPSATETRLKSLRQQLCEAALACCLARRVATPGSLAHLLETRDQLVARVLQAYRELRSDRAAVS